MGETREQIRLLDIEYADGARQLALSEAIMNAVGQGLALPTLRLYSWSEPVIILGVGQPISDLDLESCRKRGFRILRRIGGGTVVYHDADEVSIDMIVPAGHRLAPSDVHTGYRLFSELLGTALGRLDIRAEPISLEAARALTDDELMRPLCFASISPYEFFAGARKLNGLCQIRRREAIAYQSAIYNRFKNEPLLDCVKHDSIETRELRARKLDEFVTDMERARGKRVDYVQLQSALTAAAEDQFAVEVVGDSLSDWEKDETERLVSEKYASEGWTFRR